MTNTAHIITDLGIPAGSGYCGECTKVFYGQRDNEAVCGAFQKTIIDFRGRKTFGFINLSHTRRLPDCLAAEERFTATPPTEPGYYKARLRCTLRWEIVEIFKEHGWRPAVHRIGSETSYPLELFDLWSAEPIAMPEVKP